MPETTMAEVLQELLDELPNSMRAPLPAAANIVEAYEEAIAEQISDYGCIILPHLGIGQHIEVPSRSFHLAPETRTQRAFSYWHFDGRHDANWLQAALLYPFEHLDNWVVLVRREDVTEEIINQLRPPLIPRLRHTLEKLEWLIVDQGGHEGGRLERHEFLDVLGDKPWLRVEHSDRRGVVIIQRWQGKEVLERWSAQVDETFGCPYLLRDEGSPAPGHYIPTDWEPTPARTPFETAVALDILCDPYATLRRFVAERWDVDIDRLGPGILWRDSPDELFEFDENEDGILGDMARAIADRLELDQDLLTPLIDSLFERIVTGLPVHLPVLGSLREISIPTAETRMRPPARHRNPPDEKVAIIGEKLYASIPHEPDNIWKQG
ncbi:MAG: hypothetical protein ACNA8W_08600 [Bradymonadaceae bacterium]